MDEQTSHWRFKPGSYLASIIGHEGPGSLHSYLKERGWITALSTGVQELARGIATFKITFYLSQNGFREYTLGLYRSRSLLTSFPFQENYREVAMAAFKYISMLRSTDLSPTHQTEVSSLSDIRFRFAEKRRPDNYAVWMADKLSWPVPRELVVKAPQVVSEWDPDGTAQGVAFQTLKGLSVKNSRIIFMARPGEFQRLFGTQEWQSEPWYGTKYRVERLDEAFMQEVSYFPLRGQGLLISFSLRQRAQTRSMLFIFLDQTSSFLSDWTSTSGRFHKYASARPVPFRPV